LSKAAARPRHAATLVAWRRGEKGVEVLLEASALLRSRGRRFQVDLVGGAGPGAIAAWPGTRLHELQLVETVQLRGELLGAEKLRRLVEASIFALPTFYPREGLPLAILEAMQFSLPVVSTQWRGVPALVQNGQTGLLVAPRDPQALADALDRLLGDPELGRRLGIAGRERYLAHFTVERYRWNLESALAEC